ncbi:hypothetical protein [Streptomyces arboris]|uniref:Uncharacterized protein n=1 Tax=Streptomyces arboris TaxID=2600619 RepID=A0A5N5ECZ7_9ACTN|nr:hypothetical protein [Streptomyces arboris]KAB2588629.1 hypothetical protein F5983_31155 [Streptomyces arboris]
MSNSLAAAVLTTADPGEAIRAVHTLLAVADTERIEVDFEAVIGSPDVLAGVCDVLPGLEWWALPDPERGSSKAGDDPAGCLPIQVMDWCRPADRAEPFIAALGPEPAAVRWDLDGWPEVPEAGLEPISQKFAYLTLTVNSRDLYQSRRGTTASMCTAGTGTAIRPPVSTGSPAAWAAGSPAGWSSRRSDL